MDERCLPDAGGTFDKNERPLRVAGRVERVIDPADLSAAFE